MLEPLYGKVVSSAERSFMAEYFTILLFPATTRKRRWTREEENCILKKFSTYIGQGIYPPGYKMKTCTNYKAC